MGVLFKLEANFTQYGNFVVGGLHDHLGLVNLLHEVGNNLVIDVVVDLQVNLHLSLDSRRKSLAVMSWERKYDQFTPQSWQQPCRTCCC